MNEPKDEAKPEKPDACDCCRFETTALTFFEPIGAGSLDTTGRWLCELCPSTYASTMDQYKHLKYLESNEVMKTICYVGNAILKAIRDQRVAGDGPEA
jgi:hypothetical protein